MGRYDCETHPDARWDEHYECDDCRDDQEKALEAAKEALEYIGHDECSGPDEGMPICRVGIPGMRPLPKNLWCFRCHAREALKLLGDK